jgi:hypothetical protein
VSSGLLSLGDVTVLVTVVAAMTGATVDDVLLVKGTEVTAVGCVVVVVVNDVSPATLAPVCARLFCSF